MKRKQIIQWLYLLCMCTVLPALYSCSEKEEEASAATLTQVGTTSHSLSFAITPLHAEKCAWVCVKKGENIPTPEVILSDGIAVDVHTTSTQTAIALEAKTDYMVLAASLRDGKALLSAPLEMQTLAMEEQKPDTETTVLSTLVDASYAADNMTGAGTYTLTLASAETDENGYPAKVGDVAILLKLYNQSDKDPVNATLPSGEYKPEADKGAFTWDTSECMIYERNGAGSEGLAYSMLSSGTIRVERQGDIYTIHIDCATLAGQAVKASYTGVIIFKQGASAEYERFSKPQNITFTEGQALYYGNWDFPWADDWMIDFFQGEFDANNNLVDGYYLTLTDLFTHKLENHNAETPQIEEGTYGVTMNTPTKVAYNIPLTFTFGNVVELFGNPVNTGSYLVKVEKNTGKKYIGYFTGGTVKVSRSGSQYFFTFDLVTGEGVSVKGTFQKEMRIVNKNENDTTMPSRLGSTLDKDVKLNFTDDTQATAYMLGEQPFKGLNSWWLMVGSKTQDKGDWISAEFLMPVEKGTTLEEGTYTVYKRTYTPANDPAAYQLLPGWIMRNGEALYTWYSDMSSKDDQGYLSVMGRVAEGTMKVEKSGMNYRFVFNFKDDEGHAIAGEWTGPVSVQKYTPTSASTKAKRFTFKY